MRSFQNSDVVLLLDFLSDVDECTASSPVCDVNAKCQNNHGSYNCMCDSGFTGDGKTCQGKKNMKNNQYDTYYQ